MGGSRPSNQTIATNSLFGGVVSQPPLQINFLKITILDKKQDFFFKSEEGPTTGKPPTHSIYFASCGIFPTISLYLTLICVYIGFWFHSRYTNLSLNYLFEALNEFKWKSCQLKSFITFRDLQLSFWQYLHPRSFTKFEFQIYEIQTQFFLTR